MTGHLIISKDDQVFLDRLRGLSIIRVVLVHLGLSWFLEPYSQFVLVLLPLLFFVSGAVSFPIFLRSNDWIHYTVKRLSSVIIPYYVTVAVIIVSLLTFPSFLGALKADHILRWLLVSPTSEMAPFPLGQVWFLRSLLIISILSIPIFLLAQRNVNFLLAPLAVSIFLSFNQSYFDINRYFYVDFFNFYQPFVNSGFFFFGSYFYARKDFIGVVKLWLLAWIGVALSLMAFLHAGLELNMAENTYSPNLYYTGLSFSAIVLVLILKPIIQYFLDKIVFLDKVVAVFSKNAFSIFILHSLMIYLAEVIFGWKGLMADPAVAAAKIIFVIAGSVFLSYPLTAFTRIINKWFVRTLLYK